MTLELTFSSFFSLLYEFHLFLITLPCLVYLNLCLFVRGSVFVLMSDLCLLSFSCVSWSCHPIVFYRHFLPLSYGVVCCVLYLWTYGAIIKAHFLCPTYLSHVCLWVITPFLSTITNTYFCEMQLFDDTHHLSTRWIEMRRALKGFSNDLVLYLKDGWFTRNWI